MSEWQEFGVLLAIHRHAHSIKRELQPIDKPRGDQYRNAGALMRRNARSVTAEFARTVAARETAVPASLKHGTQACVCALTNINM